LCAHEPAESSSAAPKVESQSQFEVIATVRQASRPDRRPLWIGLLVMVITALGCSASDLLTRSEPTPIPTRILAPTFTSTPEELQGIVIVTPPVDGTPGVIIVPPGTDPRDVIPVPPSATPTDVPTELVPFLTASAEPTETPTFSPTPSETPTFTPTGTPSFTPTTTPTSFIMVASGLVALRQGPSVEFPMVAQLGPNIPIAITGQSPDGQWYQICCVNNASVWVVASHVQVNGDPRAVQLIVGGTPPPPTPTLPPTATGTQTFTPTATPYPFLRSYGPQYYPTNNEFITIWVKLHIGTNLVQTTCDPDNTTANRESAAPGYYLKVLFNNFERPSTNGNQQSAAKFECSAPPGAGNRFEYNLKYEYRPPDPRSITFPALTPTPSQAQLIGDGTWTFYVVDGAGNQLSAAETFTSQSSNPNREVYVAWERIR